MGVDTPMEIDTPMGVTISLVLSTTYTLLQQLFVFEAICNYSNELPNICQVPYNIIFRAYCLAVGDSCCLYSVNKFPSYHLQVSGKLLVLTYKVSGD